MANQKQRSRRAKEKRHGIEIVEIDEEGNERVLDSSVLKPAGPPARVKGKDAKGGRGSGRGSGGGASGRGGARGAGAYREVKPASWGRALKRAGIFGPLFLVFFLLVKPEKTGTAAVVIQALAMIALFVPLSYYMDRFAHRQYLRRSGKSG